MSAKRRLPPKRREYRTPDILSRELREVFAAFAPEHGVATKRFDSTHGFLQTACSPSLHPESPVTISISKGNDEYAKRNFHIAVTWRYWECLNNSTNACEYLTRSYEIFLGMLKKVTFSVVETKRPGSDEIENVRTNPHHREKGERFPPKITQTLVEIGRLLAHDMKMDIKIPDAPAPHQQGRSR